LVDKEKMKCGSLNYMPPEIINNSDIEAKPSIDIWGLGCILYELVTGEVLFKGKIDEIKEKVCNKKQRKFPIGLSNEIRDLLEKTLKYYNHERENIRSLKIHPWLKNSLIEKPLQVEENQLKVNRTTKKKEVNIISFI